MLRYPMDIYITISIGLKEAFEWIFWYKYSSGRFATAGAATFRYLRLMMCLTFKWTLPWRPSYSALNEELIIHRTNNNI